MWLWFPLILRLGQNNYETGTMFCDSCVLGVIGGLLTPDAHPRRRGGSTRQGELTLLQETPDRGIALETDRDFVRLAGFAVCACPSQ
jgi:hypothetical protein